MYLYRVESAKMQMGRKPGQKWLSASGGKSCAAVLYLSAIDSSLSSSALMLSSIASSLTAL